MNPKTLNNLDPKLKETYERVMGTSFNPAGNPPPVQTQATQTPQQTYPNGTHEAVQLPQNQSAQVFRADDPFKAPDPPPADVVSKGYVASPPQEEKKKHKIPAVLYVLVGLVFFVVYAVVWAKFFGLF